jgi:hypothetical protein
MMLLRSLSGGVFADLVLVWGGACGAAARPASGDGADAVGHVAELRGQGAEIGR